MLFRLRIVRLELRQFELSLLLLGSGGREGWRVSSGAVKIGRRDLQFGEWWEGKTYLDLHL